MLPTPDSVGAVPRTAPESKGAHFTEMRPQEMAEVISVGAVPRTAPSLPPPPGFFSPNGNVRVWHGDLPHWQQAGVATFVTLRAAGSLPRGRMDELQDFDAEWRATCPDPTNEELRQYVRQRRELVERWLDAGEGPCPFASAAACRAVESSLWAENGRSCWLYAYVVMPNHVHVLLLPFDAFVEKALTRFKRFVSREVNRLNRESGSVWQREHYDTLIRDEEHFRRVRDYIWKNCPSRAWDCYRALEGKCAVRGTAPTEMDGSGFQ